MLENAARPKGSPTRQVHPEHGRAPILNEKNQGAGTFRSILLTRQSYKPFKALAAAFCPPWCTLVAGPFDFETGERETVQHPD